MRLRAFRLFLLISIAFLAVSGQRMIYPNRSQNIAFRPLPLATQGKAPAKIGAFTFLGAWEIQSENQDFGGFSALTALRDGRFLAISDAGTMAVFSPPGAPYRRSFIVPLPGAFGPKVGFRDRDSEGIAYDPISGNIWISYEGNPAIRRLSPSLSRVNGITRPAALRAWKGNSGGEALVRLSDGRFILFSEDQERNDGSFEALLFQGDPVEKNSKLIEFGYHPPQGYKPTDALELPDGRILILNRRIAFPNGFSAKLTLADPKAIKAEEAIKGQVIATIKSPIIVDNFEGITLTQEKGQTIIWLISDNNFNIWQRTLLMKFAINIQQKKPKADETAPGFESLK
jgi:hypothetical protein